MEGSADGSLRIDFVSTRAPKSHSPAASAIFNAIFQISYSDYNFSISQSSSIPSISFDSVDYRSFEVVHIVESASNPLVFPPLRFTRDRLPAGVQHGKSTAVFHTGKIPKKLARLIIY